MSAKEKIYLFDFDGTLTTGDTLLEFLKYSRGAFCLFLAFLLFSPLLVLMKLHLYNNGKVKQKIFSFYYKGDTLDHFNEMCRKFACHRSDLFRQQAREYIAGAVASGDQVFIVSASIDNWVIPFFYPDGYSSSGRYPVRIVGTQLEVRDGKLTGRFGTPNCYGAEKVRRVEALLPHPRCHYEIEAFGDSRGDQEMLEYADQGHYKPFRQQ